MVRLATLFTTLAVAISAVSATCICEPGQNYCGWTLLGDTHGCQTSDLASEISSDINNSLYECNVGGNSAKQIQFCGGPGTCQPPQHDGGACDGVNSCCD